MKASTSRWPVRKQLRKMASLRMNTHVAVNDCGTGEKGDWIELAVAHRNVTLFVKIGGDSMGQGEFTCVSVRSQCRRAEWISERMLDRIRKANDIVDVINSYLPSFLRGAKGPVFNTVCPLNRDGMRPFYVDRDSQLFKCTGCGVSGDVFKFVMLRQQVEFHDAVRLLAKRAGILLKPGRKG